MKFLLRIKISRKKIIFSQLDQIIIERNSGGKKFEQISFGVIFTCLLGGRHREKKREIDHNRPRERGLEGRKKKFLLLLFFQLHNFRSLIIPLSLFCFCRHTTHIISSCSLFDKSISSSCPSTSSESRCLPRHRLRRLVCVDWFAWYICTMSKQRKKKETTEKRRQKEKVFHLSLCSESHH